MRISLALMFAALALVGCGKPGASDTAASWAGNNGGEPAPTVLSATVNGRTVRATIAAPPTIEPEGDAVVVTTAEHKFVVERERVTIDGDELLKLRPTIDFVEFYLNSQGYFTMNADRAGVATKQLPSATPFKKQQIGGATRLDGRTVHFSVFGDGTISPEGETAVITTDAHKIVVKPQRVTVDGVEVVQVPATAEDVRVRLTADNQFTVQIDGYTSH